MSSLLNKPGSQKLWKSRLGFLLWGIRIDNIIFFLGFPVMGALLAIPNFSRGTLLKLFWFSVLSALFLTQMFLFNDLCDGIINPEEPRYRARHALKHPELINHKQILGLFIFLSLLSIFGIFMLSFWAGLMIFANWLLSTIYSYPRFSLKRHPILPELVHLFFASLPFLSGWIIFKPLTLESILLALFFGLVLASGEMVNQITDFEQELKVGLRSSAIVFGKRPLYHLSLWIFYLSSLYLLALSLLGIISGWIKWSAMFLILAWTIYLLFPRPTTDFLSNISKFPRTIRTIYAGFSLLLLVFIILNKV